MTWLNKFFILTICLIISACSSLNGSNNKFDYFYQQDSFNIAAISLHNISILGIIDDTNTLASNEKQQLTQYVYSTFADKVDAENLIDSAYFAQQIGQEQYRQLSAAAKQNQLDKMNKLMISKPTLSRYLLTIRLTKNIDHSSNNDFFSQCSSYGRTIGLTMAIIDNQTSSMVWNGHINKSTKNSHCNDDYWLDNDHGDRHNNTIYDNEQHEKNVISDIFITLLATIVVGAITEDNSTIDDVFAANELLPNFKQAVNAFAKRLPSFYQ
jgi:uncharacterized protein YciU (UPF0263 family)